MRSSGNKRSFSIKKNTYKDRNKANKEAQKRRGKVSRLNPSQIREAKKLLLKRTKLKKSLAAFDRELTQNIKKKNLADEVSIQLKSSDDSSSEQRS